MIFLQILGNTIFCSVVPTSLFAGEIFCFTLLGEDLLSTLIPPPRILASIKFYSRLS